MVRVLKNLRSKLVADGDLKAGLAPSYYLEGLLYNVPNEKFGNSYADCFVNAMNWIQTEADKDKLLSILVQRDSRPTPRWTKAISPTNRVLPHDDVVSTSAAMNEALGSSGRQCLAT